MFDEKKLEAFLDSLEVEKHFPDKAPAKIVPAPKSALDRLMDKYDIFKQSRYRNVGMPEMPIWAPPEDNSGITLAMLQNAFYQYQPMTYAGISRVPMRTWQYLTGIDTGADPKQAPKETPHEKLIKRVGRLNSVNPQKLTNPNPRPPAPPQSPDLVHTITAWRAWDVRGGMLEALGTEYQWTPKEAARARCVNGRHAAPHMQCVCGFWSFKVLKDLLNALPSYAENVPVVGTVEIWGRVIECENGFRSEYAYPKELWLLKDGLESLSWDYGVPVRRMEGVK